MISPECAPSSINETAVAPDYVCAALNKKFANDDYALTFTYTLANNWNKLDETCPAVVNELNVTKVYTCPVAKLTYPNCTKFKDANSCIAPSNCNDASHGC